MTKRILVVGRHVGQLPSEFEVVEQQSISFNLDFMECAAQVQELFARAAMLDAVPVFQNTPGILAAVLSQVSGKWGVIVSVPGERKAGVTKVFDFGMPQEVASFYGMAGIAEEVVKFVNARAHTTVNENFEKLMVTVDPIPEFVFDHIEFVDNA